MNICAHTSLGTSLIISQGHIFHKWECCVKGCAYCSFWADCQIALWKVSADIVLLPPAVPGRAWLCRLTSSRTALFFLILTDFNYKKTQHLTKVSILMSLLAINAELLNMFLCEFLLPVIDVFHYIIFKWSQCWFLISSLKAEALLVQYIP